MFKSIRWKIVLLFILSVLAGTVVMGAFQILIPVHLSGRAFSASMNSVFSEEFVQSLQAAANEINYPVDTTDAGSVVIEESSAENIRKMVQILDANAAVLGIGPDRFYCILDGSTGNVLYSQNAGQSANLEKTPGIITAMSGTAALETKNTLSYMDYAYPMKFGDSIKYIVYIKDTKQALVLTARKAFSILLYSLILALALAFLFGNYIAKSVTIPLKKLSLEAKRLADGDSDAIDIPITNDELGDLTSSLALLAHTRKESSEAAKSEKIKVETILQNMTDGILAFNLRGRLTHINPEAQRLLHRKYLDDIQFDRFFKEINANITMGDLLYVKPEDSLEREVMINKDQFIKLNFATFNIENKVGGILVVIHDITKQEKLEQSRRDFVADVSHELRTPLTTIKSYAETLTDNPAADKELQVRFLDVIASEADRMSRILSDLLTLSELDDKKTSYRMPENIDVRKMLETIVERMGMTAKKKEQLLLYTPINEVPQINGDRDSLERVIINIISNALKYTPTGGRIDVFSSKVYNDICIKVVDNGIGIPKENLPNIFDRFYRVDKARSRDTGGTGLGLAIAKQALESSFGGKIKITSELNQGTEVIISIPVQS